MRARRIKHDRAAFDDARRELLISLIAIHYLHRLMRRAHATARVDFGIVVPPRLFPFDASSGRLHAAEIAMPPASSANAVNTRERFDILSLTFHAIAEIDTRRGARGVSSRLLTMGRETCGDVYFSNSSPPASSYVTIQNIMASLTRFADRHCRHVALK